MSGSVVQPGQKCDFAVDFAPPAAQSYQETYTATSNSLNVTTSTNDDTLYGNGTGVPTATALSVTPSPASVGQAVMLTATITSSNPGAQAAPTGAVSFFDGTTLLGSGNLSSGGVTQYSTSSLAPGTHSITAKYVGDSLNASSTSAAQILQVGPNGAAPVTTNLLQNPGAELGTLQYWTIGGPGTPTVDTGTFDSGINPHTGTYDFLGHDSASDSLSQTVSVLQQGVTAAQLDSGALFAEISFWEQGLNQGAVSDDGSVTLAFLDVHGATISTVNSATIDSHDLAWTNGTGTFAIPSGTRSITYTMNFMRNVGSDLDAFIDDNSLTVAANTNTGSTASATTLASTPNTPRQGQTVTFQVTVAAETSTGTPPTPTGTVTLTNTTTSPATTLGTATLASDGTATLKYSGLPVGNASVVATYSGDATYAASQSAADSFGVVAALQPTTTLTVTPTTVAYQTPVTLSATVQAGDSNLGYGQVYFCDAAAAQCSLNSNLGIAQIASSTATATLKLAPGTIGTHNFTATYVPTPGILTSQSAPQTVSVTGKYPSTTAFAATGNAGSYSVTGTVVSKGSNTVSPTGMVSFLDTSNANASLGSAGLGSGTLGFTAAQPAGGPNATGEGSYGQAAGDFNGDGFLDLVVENYEENTVSILLGKGDGTFQPEVKYSVGGEPERVLVTDLDGDGKLDLVVANTASGTISVLLGNGDGTFQTQVTYPCASPVGLGIMDINGDGFPDVVAGDYYSNTMSVLLGNKDGTLQAAVTYPTGSTPQTLVEGDFNGDGKVDVAVGNLNDNTVGIFLGNGDGTFRTMVTYAVGAGPQGVQAADFNGDGKLDLAVTNHEDATVSILLGNGDGTFQTQVTYPVGKQPVGLVIADFNGDGKQDIAVGNTDQSTLYESILLGNGDGTFQAQLTYPTGNFPYGESVGDFNGDGYPDIGVSNFSDGTAIVLLSQATQTATATRNVTIGGSSTSTHAVEASYAGDLNVSASVSATMDLSGGGAVTEAPSTTMLTIAPAAATAGQNVTFSVAVAGASQTTPVPTGTVTVTNTAVTPAVALGTITLNANGGGSSSTTSLPAGTYSVVASYSGDAIYQASTSAAQTLTIAKIAQTITFPSHPEPHVGRRAVYAGSDRFLGVGGELYGHLRACDRGRKRRYVGRRGSGDNSGEPGGKRYVCAGYAGLAKLYRDVGDGSDSGRDLSPGHSHGKCGYHSDANGSELHHDRPGQDQHHCSDDDVRKRYLSDGSNSSEPPDGCRNTACDGDGHSLRELEHRGKLPGGGGSGGGLHRANDCSIGRSARGDLPVEATVRGADQLPADADLRSGNRDGH